MNSLQQTFVDKDSHSSIQVQKSKNVHNNASCIC